MATKKRYSSADTVRDKLNFALMGWMVDLTNFTLGNFGSEEAAEELERRLRERVQLVDDVSRETAKEKRQLDGTKTSDSTVQDGQTELHLDCDGGGAEPGHRGR